MRTIMTSLVVVAAFQVGAGASSLAGASQDVAVAPSSQRILRAEVSVKAPLAEAWKAWTTEAGIATFFAPEGHVDLEVDGTYDIWFDPAGLPGQRGAEGMRILDVDPLKRFAFTWNAPPTIASIRGKRTLVVLDFVPIDAATTKVRFTHLGWGEGPDWDKAYAYFDRAWAAVVLPRFVHRFARGPIDWKAPPELPPVARSIRATLVETR